MELIKSGARYKKGDRVLYGMLGYEMSGTVSRVFIFEQGVVYYMSFPVPDNGMKLWAVYEEETIKKL